jgi:phage terminase small subunit
MTNAREARFVEEYVTCLNATQAAIRAGYSARTAKQQGSRLLTRPHVAAAVQEAQERHAAKVEVKADEVIRELKVMAFARDDIRDSDKLKALELLGRHLKMFTDKIEQTGESFAELVLGATRLRRERDAKKGLNYLNRRPLQPGDALYAENEEAAKAAQAAYDAEHGGAPRGPPSTPAPAPAPAAEPSEPEIGAQPDPEPLRFNPLAYLRGGSA